MGAELWFQVMERGDGGGGGGEEGGCLNLEGMLF